MTYDVELSDEDERDEGDSEPRSVDSSKGLERQLLDRVALDGPSLAKADVAQADRSCEGREQSARTVLRKRIEARLTPGEKGRESRKGKEPIEDSSTGGGDVDVGDLFERKPWSVSGLNNEQGAGSTEEAYRTPCEDEQNRPERATTLVDVGEDLRGVAGLGEGGEDTGSGVDAGEADRKDGDADGRVDQV
jgi:hypothetical protein